MPTRDSEVLVIGGGIAGVSTAYHLALYGHDVTLLERGDIASEASGVNAGHIGAIGWGDDPGLESHLTMGSLDIFRSLQLDMGYDIEFRQSGSLQAIQNEEQHQFAVDSVSRLRSHGYTLELLSTREGQGMEPELSAELRGFVYMPLRAQADPQKATRAAASAAARNGAKMLTGTEVTGIRQRGDGRYQVQTQQGDFIGQKLLIAAGAWCKPIGEMLGLSIPIVPVRGQMWATEILPPRLFHTISAIESAFHWHKDPGNGPETPPELTHRKEQRVTRHLYGRQTRQGEVIFGGDRQAVGFEQAPDFQGIEENRGHAAEVIPMLRDLPIKRAWAGLMPFSLDGHPVIGQIPQRDNLYIVSGLCSSGFGRGPMAGKLLAQYVHTGHKPLVLAEAEPARCVTLAGST